MTAPKWDGSLSGPSGPMAWLESRGPVYMEPVFDPETERLVRWKVKASGVQASAPMLIDALVECANVAKTKAQ